MIGVREPLPGIVYPPQDRLTHYVESGALPTTGLIDELIRSFRRNADRPALCGPAGTISYAELDDATDRFAGALIDLGFEPLDRVLFQSTNSPELVIALIGCLKAGLIPTCTLAAHREREIGYLGRHVDARLHIVQDDDPKFDLVDFARSMAVEIPTIRHIISLRGRPREGISRLEDLIAGHERGAARKAVASIARDPFQVAIFQLSGGTTGVPKVIPRMQNDYLLNATLTADILGYRFDDVMFMPMPIIHNACMICFLMPTLLVGGAFVIAADMTPAQWAAAFRRTPPTFVGLIRALMPRLEEALKIEPAALDTIRTFWSADAARLLRAKYGKPAYAMFGMSEGMNMYCREGDPDEALDWTAGRPMSSFDEIRIVARGTMNEVGDEEIGELVCRGPYTLSGYYDAPERNSEAFTPDGFYKPGDLMIRRLIDGRQYYAFAGRTKDVVDRGTEKINCEEVEGAVSMHEAVLGCAVVGMPDPVLGQRVCAYVVLRSAFPPPGVAEMQAHLKAAGLAKFKWPERIEVIDALPLTKVGKLDKAVLRTDIAERLQRETIRREENVT
jgi:non-ribosomal peptide synthetase component E (peptide arylation enzyme)